MPIFDVRKFIDSVDWQFAKTMPEIPHEYIVTDDYPEKAEEINNLMEMMINLLDSWPIKNGTLGSRKEPNVPTQLLPNREANCKSR